jgi:hypothetical protein
VTVVAGRVGGDARVDGDARADGRVEGQPQPFLDRLERLADELTQRGLRATVLTPAGRVPSLHVVNPLASRLAEDVYVGRSQDGQWWFWWPWAERIAQGDAYAEAAAVIAKVLETVEVQDPPSERPAQRATRPASDPPSERPA